MLWTSYSQASVSSYVQWHSHVHKAVFCTSSTISCSYNRPITIAMKMCLGKNYAIYVPVIPITPQSLIFYTLTIYESMY